MEKLYITLKMVVVNGKSLLNWHDIVIFYLFSIQYDMFFRIRRLIPQLKNSNFRNNNSNLANFRPPRPNLMITNCAGYTSAHIGVEVLAQILVDSLFPRSHGL